MMIRYDIPAMVLLMSGCMIIVFNCNFEEITYTADDIQRLLFNVGNLVLYGLIAFGYGISKVCDFWFRRILIDFERRSSISMKLNDF